MTKLLIIDGHNLFYRSYHGLSNHLSFQGKDTWAVLGMANSLSAAIRIHEPTHLLVVFDQGKSAYREAIYADYKGNRQDSVTLPHHESQIGRSQGLLATMGMRVYREVGVEADDIIGAAVRAFERSLDQILVYSGDKDLRQVVSEKVTVIHPSLGQKPEQAWTLDRIISYYGMEPAKLPEVWALCGDKSDNIPGVPGIGEKTALKLILEYGDASKVAMSDHKKVQGQSQTIAMSLKLVELNPDASDFDLSVDDVAWNPPQPGTTEGNLIAKALEELGFDALLSRWQNSKLWLESGIRLRDLHA